MRVRPAIIALTAVILMGGVLLFRAQVAVAPESHNSLPKTDAGIPLPDALGRITKKSFGVHVSPKDSPVQPERFTGYHTGVDFELAPGEDPHTLNVRALCTGPLLESRTASGYGGVAVQSCTIQTSPVTVVYGHVRLSSITTPVGTVVQQGEIIGNLGAGYSAETDGERAHLHLGVHRGTAVNIRGYAATPAELSGWIDPVTLVP